MTVTIHDEATAALAKTATLIELRGPDGRTLGLFAPFAPNVADIDFGVTDEEIDRMVNDPNTKWCTPDEVMARLRAINEAS